MEKSSYDLQARWCWFCAHLYVARALWLAKGLGSPVHESWTWLNEWIVQRMYWCLVALCNSCSYGWPSALSPSWLLILLEKRKNFQCQMPNLRRETDCQPLRLPMCWDICAWNLEPFFFSNFPPFSFRLLIVFLSSSPPLFPGFVC